ncbi:hypothetical protein J1TS3_29360 [Siminovitchia fordii]|uniref:Uncharacterized protein n=1 Tax=Siminovitchia fordii TaxID=254759 RepID=A0ABQ4K7U2_9BACI|nr:hypothetical protein J1TS3_29360 [Siminovitchia fordii]
MKLKNQVLRIHTVGSQGIQKDYKNGQYRTGQVSFFYPIELFSLAIRACLHFSSQKSAPLMPA